MLQRTDTDAAITLPPRYLRENCELGYALTAHRAQGATVDVVHLYIPDGAHMTRELLYVAMTRGAAENHTWSGLPDLDDDDAGRAENVLAQFYRSQGSRLTHPVLGPRHRPR